MRWSGSEGANKDGQHGASFNLACPG